MRKFLSLIVMAAMFLLPLKMQAQVTLPYTCGFESTDNFTAWTMTNCDASSGLMENSAVAHSGSVGFAFSYNTNPPQFLISPEFSGTTTMSGVLVEFWYKNYSSNYPESFMVGYSTTTSDTSAFTWGTEITASNTQWTLYSNTFPTGTKYVAIKLTSYDEWYLFIDDFVAMAPPTCIQVTGLTVDSLSTTSVSLSWTDADNTSATYTVYNGTTQVATGITTTSYTFTGLTTYTSYTLGVVANCSATDASAMATISVRTAADCPLYTVPFTETFDTNSTSLICWTMIDADGDGRCWADHGGINAYTSQSYDNDYGALTPDNWLISPRISLAAGNNYEVTWTARPQDLNYPYEHYALYISTTSNLDTSNFTLLQAWTLTADDNPQTPVINLSNYAGQDVYLALRHWDCTDWYWLVIDNFIVRQPAGANQVVVDVNANNAFYGTVTGGGIYDIGDTVTVTATANTGYSFAYWTNNGGTTVSYDNPYTFIAATDTMLIANFVSGTYDPDTTEDIAITIAVNDATMGTTIPAPGIHYFEEGDVYSITAVPNNGYVLSEWTVTATLYGQSTTYSLPTTDLTISDTITADYASLDVVITAVFAADSTSTTTCDPVVVTSATPFSEGFESGVLGDCWGNISSGNATWTVATGDYNTSTGAHSGSYNAKLTHTSSGTVTLLTTPTLDLTSLTNCQLNFWYVNRSWSGDIDGLNVYYRTANSTTWTSLDSISDAHSTWTEATYTLPNTAVQVAFEMVDDYGYGVGIDDIYIGETPTCLAVTDLTVIGVTANSVTLSWSDALNSGATYSVYNGNGNVEATGLTDTTYTVTGLTAETNYIFGVIANCSATDASTVVTVNAYTGYCSPNPTSVDNSGITSVSFGGVTNTTHPTSAGYANYYNISGNVPAGTTATVDITYATNYTYGTIIWVDWDNSLTFDGDEVVYVGTSTSNNPTVLSATFDIPATQPLGSYRMRIVGADSYFDSYTTSIADAANANPCATYSWGVAEDYTLNVITAPTCIAVADLAVSNVTSSSITLSWVDTLNSGATYTVLNMADTSVVATGITTTTYTVTNLSASTGYTFGVIANCSATEASFISQISANTDCASGNCNLTIFAEDEYGDGWNNASIDFVQNGTIMGNYAMAGQGVSGSTIYDTATVSVCAGTPITLNWNNGSYDYEISFTILNANNIEVFSIEGAENLYGSFLTLDSCTALGDTTTTGADSVTFILTVNDPTMGTTNPVPGTYTVAVGDNFSVTATPYTGYYFIGWVESVTYMGTTLSDTLIDPTETTLGGLVDDEMSMFESITLTALFSADSTFVGGDSINITIAVNDPMMGTTTPVPGTYTYAVGDNFSVTAIPYTGYYFIGWAASITYMGYTETDTLFDPTETTMGGVIDDEMTMYDNLTLTALFSTDSTFVGGDSINITIAVNDPMMGTTTPVPGTYTYAVGDNFNVTAIPYTGYYFIGWAASITYMGYTETDTLFDPTETTMGGVIDDEMTMFDNLTLTALFSTDSTFVGGDSVNITFAVNDPTMGTTIPAPGTYSYAPGDIMSITARAYEGYELLDWTITMTYMGTTQSMPLETNETTLIDTVISYLLEMDSIVITAVFGPEGTVINGDTLTLVTGVNDATMGTITPAPGTYYYAEGDVINITATANEGYHLTGWHFAVAHPVYGTIVDTVIYQPIPVISEEVDEEMLGYVYTFIAQFASNDGIEDVTTVNINAYSREGQIVLTGAEGREVYVFDINGRQLHHSAKANATETYSVPATGVYLIKVDGVETKRVVVMR